MHSSPSMLLAILAIALPSTLALPQYPIPCDDYPPTTSYSITSQQTNVPGPLVMADFSCGGGDSLSDTSTYSTSITITVGIDLSLDPDDIAGNAGISASVATTTTTGTTQGVTADCPAGLWECGMAIAPEMIEVIGVMTVTDRPLCPDPVVIPSDFTMLFPVKNADGLVGGNANGCTCKNYLHWADPGALALCPSDCPT